MRDAIAADLAARSLPVLRSALGNRAGFAHAFAAGLGVTLVPKSMSRLHPDGVVFIPIEGPSLSAEISLAYRRTQRSAAVRNFVTVARHQAQIAAHAAEPRDSSLRSE